MAGPFAYQPQGAPKAMPLPQSRQGFGEDVAAGIGALGAAAGNAGEQQARTTMQIAAIEKERRQASEYSAHAVDWAHQQGDLRAKIYDMRQDPNADPRTLGDRAKALLDDAVNQRLGQIADPEVRNRLAPQLVEWSANQIADAHIAGEADGAELQVAQHGEWRNTTANNLQSDPGSFGAAMQSGIALRGSYGLPMAVAGKLEEEDNAVLSRAAALGHVEANPQKGLALLQGGNFDNWLRPDDKSTLVNHAETLLRQRDVERRQAVAEQRRDGETFLQSITDRVTNHIPVPPEDFQRAGQLIGNPDLKLDGKAFDIGKMQAFDHFARVYQNASPVTMSGRIKQLDAEIAHDKDKVKPEHVLERDWLAAALPQRAAEQRADPLARFARGGGEVTPVDFNDPKTLSYRLIQAKQAQGRDGGPLTVLQDQEAEPLRQRLASGGAAGRVEVANALAQGGTEFAVAAARQLAPQDMHFRVASALAAMGAQGRAAARDSLLGSEAIAAHRAIVREEVAQEVFGQWSPAMTGLDPQMHHGIYDAALGIFATRRLKQGKVEWPNAKAGDDDGDARAAFLGALEAALGASRRPNGEVEGGFGHWGDYKIVLPSGMTQREFETAFSRAAPADFERAAGGATPVLANGIAPSWGQFKSMKLEAVGDGLYRVRFGNGYLAAKDGHGIYEFDARKLPRVR